MACGIVGSPPSKMRETYEPLDQREECNFLENMIIVSERSPIPQENASVSRPSRVANPLFLSHPTGVLAEVAGTFLLSERIQGGRVMTSVFSRLASYTRSRISYSVNVTEYLGSCSFHFSVWTDVGVSIGAVVRCK